MPTRVMSLHTQAANPVSAQVLLVEDDIELREGLAENLRLNGHNVHEVATGAAFRAAIAVSQIEVAIIDVNLPDASGFELARELSREDDRPGIIILTARNGRRDRVQGYADGADLYMTKPVDNDELAFAVRNLAARIAQSRSLRPRPEASQQVWTLDVARRLLISPDGRFLNLTGKEVMLLELFEKSGEDPLSRTLLASLMGYDAPGPHHRALDAAIRRLKEKATRAGIELPFLVVRSVGIRFVGMLRKDT